MSLLLASVAHELNNPLTAIAGFTQLLLMGERPAAEREDLETIAREAQRMLEIVSRLSLLCRGGPQEECTPRPVDIGDVVRHVLRTRANAFRARTIEVREDIDPDLPPALGDRVSIEQIVLNLVVNAEQALAGADGPARLTVRAHPSRAGISLQVIDSGPGIAAEHLDRIFDPFFTTKDPGEGTGLGLALVYGLVEAQGGSIHVDSRVGAGTTFHVELQSAKAAPRPPPVRHPHTVDAVPGRPLHVLVVDDEEPVRLLVTRLLEKRGHLVDKTAAGSGALELIEHAARAGSPYHVIVFDPRMPGMDGMQLLKRLGWRDDDAWGGVVFLTGDTAGVEVERISTETQLNVLTKPVHLDTLAVVVERVGRATLSRQRGRSETMG